MAGLPTLITTISAMRAAAQKASADLKAWAAANPTNPAARTALDAAADIDLVLASTALETITDTSFEELKTLVVAGKSIVHHQPVDTFGG